MDRSQRPIEFGFLARIVGSQSVASANGTEDGFRARSWTSKLNQGLPKAAVIVGSLAQSSHFDMATDAEWTLCKLPFGIGGLALQYWSCSFTQLIVPPVSFRPLGVRSSQLNAPIRSSVPR